MRALTLAGIGCCVVALSAGCDWNADAQSGAGPPKASPVSSAVIVDLQDVLKRLGRDKDLDKQLDEWKKTHQQQFNELSATLEKQFADKKSSFGEKPTPEQLQELQSLRRQNAFQLNQLQRQINNDFSDFQRQLVNRFREEVKPVASAVAKKRSATLVLARDDGIVLVYENAADITDDVVQGMLASPAAVAPPANESAKDKAAP